MTKLYSGDSANMEYKKLRKNFLLEHFLLFSILFRVPTTIKMRFLSEKCFFVDRDFFLVAIKIKILPKELLDKKFFP